MAFEPRALGDITNRAPLRGSSAADKPPFYKSEKTAALINYYKNNAQTLKQPPCVQFYTDRGEALAKGIQQQPFLVPITDRASNKPIMGADFRQQLWSTLSKMTFDDICSHLDNLGVMYDRNNPKDFLVDTLRRFLINDIN